MLLVKRFVLSQKLVGLRGVKQTDPENPILKSTSQAYARNLDFSRTCIVLKNVETTGRSLTDLLMSAFFNVERQYFVETRAQLLSKDK